MTIELANSNLFKPIKVGAVELTNRLVLAPTTRMRVTENNVPTDSMLEYYKQRAKNNGGLQIVEATFPSPEFGLFEFIPQFKTKEQIEAFKKIVDAVHSENTKIALQFWNLGRTADPEALKKRGLPLIGPSAIYYDEATEKKAKEVGNELRAMTTEEIKSMIKEYAAAAKRAINEAGFDLIEIAAANMFLPDQFLQESSNQRTDEYGGSIENRSRFILDVVDACIEAVGANRIGLKFSPYSEIQGNLGIKADINPIITWGYIFNQLENRAKNGNRVAYISLVEPRIAGTDDAEPIDVNFSWPELFWNGPIIRNGGYLNKENYDELEQTVDKDDRTLIASSRYYTSNPDLSNRLKNNFPLTPYDRSTFYVPQSNVGYLGYGNYGEEFDHSKDDVKPVALV